MGSECFLVRVTADCNNVRLIVKSGLHLRSRASCQLCLDRERSEHCVFDAFPLNTIKIKGCLYYIANLICCGHGYYGQVGKRENSR